MTRSIEDLLAEVRDHLAPLQARAVDRNGIVAIDLLRADDEVIMRDFTHGQNATLALLAAEQRYLVEQVGTGAVVGSTYSDKAHERLRRWIES